MALASRNGHSDLVDVLVKLYGCSISDAEKVNHVTPDNTPLSCMSLMGWSIVMFCHFPVLTSQHLFSYITTTFSYRFANLLHEF